MFEPTRIRLIIAAFCCASPLVFAQVTVIKTLPPAGIKIPEADRRELEESLKKLGDEIEALQNSSKGGAALAELLPDVQIFHKAVHYVLDYNEFFRSNETGIARRLLDQGLQRARELSQSKPSWTRATGLVVRAYVSKLDGSVQPYGLIVPAAFASDPSRPRRLECWFHGRDETLTELKFIDQRQKSWGEFSPADTFVLHLYGRYCNASKFAGEIDLFEALADVKKNYPIDENRIGLMGFSMGGASVWHLATHYAGLWAAASPGAGFAETPEYLKVSKRELPPTWYEEKLWHLYNATDYAGNLFNCPLIAYSGEIDPQRQSADIMAKAMAAEGLTLEHIIGPNTAHKYEPESKKRLALLFDVLMAKGREPAPKEIHFTTWTLRYNQMKWVVLDGLEKHWEQARITAKIADAGTITATTTNINALTFSFARGECPLEASREPKVILDGQELTGSRVAADKSWSVRFRKLNGQWLAAGERMNASSLAPPGKIHGLQGPIDDAFMDPFLLVLPTARTRSSRMRRTIQSEFRRATEEWRAQFRGDPRVKNENNLTPSDIANYNLILFGDPSSSQWLNRVRDKLPIRWTDKEIKVGTQTFAATNNLVAMICPNPLNPKRYLVLNSSFTFRGYGSNADQTPKLPDYAVIDVDVPASEYGMGRIVTAGFFDEHWKVPPDQPPQP